MGVARRGAVMPGPERPEDMTTRANALAGAPLEAARKWMPDAFIGPAAPHGCYNTFTVVEPLNGCPFVVVPLSVSRFSPGASSPRTSFSENFATRYP